jgi:tRNA(fMet)-specific endonuclease VapC
MVRMKYLLDTNVISNLIKYPERDVAKSVARLRSGDLGTSIIVSAELKFGYIKKASKRLEELIEGTLDGFEIAPWKAPADAVYARLRADLETRGQKIGQNDMLIAAHALALDVVLVTANEKEFSRVPELKIENWVRA